MADCEPDCPKEAEGEAQADAADQRLARLLEHLEGQLPHRRRLPIRSRRRVYFLDINDIEVRGFAAGRREADH